MLNRAIEALLEETEVPKFLVITKLETEVVSSEKIAFEVKPLSPHDAARLLIILVPQNIEEKNKALKTLSSH